MPSAWIVTLICPATRDVILQELREVLMICWSWVLISGPSICCSSGPVQQRREGENQAIGCIEYWPAITKRLIRHSTPRYFGTGSDGRHRE